MKKVFITGGTSGIGLELAKKYLQSGYQVGVCGRDLSKLSDELKGKFKTYELSVTESEKLKIAIEDFGKDGLDLVIANAGRSHGSKTKIPDFKVGKDIIETNVIGVLNTFGPALEIMFNQGYGHLVGIASVAGFVGLPGASSYSASKSAVIKLCESLTLDLKKHNIDVTTICPGFIDTPLTKKNDHSMPFIIPVEKGADIIKNAIDKKKKLYVFPWQMKFVILTLAAMPRFLYRAFMNLPFANYSKD